MHRIQVCIGSGCHLKGSYQIISRLKQLVNEHQTAVEIKLAASFCQGRCQEGVVLRIDDELITRVSPENVDEIYRRKVLNCP